MRPVEGRGVHARLTVPNAVTVLRMVMAVVAAACFASGVAGRLAVVLCAAAALLDVFDGWYARAFSQCSSLGAHLDPLADKLLMAVVYGVIAVGMGSALVWTLVALIGVREAAMTVFRSYSLRRHGRFIPANALGKLKMIAQSVVGVGVVAYAYWHSGGFDFASELVVLPLVLILCLSYVSAGAYLRDWRTARSMAARRSLAAVTADRGGGKSERVAVGG